MALGAIVGGGIAALGSIYGANKAGDAADKAAEGAELSAAASLAFDKQRYEDWLSVYGPIQDNLANYFGTLDADTITVRGLEAYEREYQDAIVSLDESLAQRGIQDSGLRIELDRLNTMDRARTRADIRTTAEDEVAMQKLGFLQVGLGQNPADRVSANLNNLAVQDRADSASASIAAGSAMSDAISSTGKFIGDTVDYGTDKGWWGG